MSPLLLPILLFVACSAALAAGLLLVGVLIGPHRQSAVKQMPYESGMDPIHDARRRFDVRFHLVAVAFLLFDVEVIFLYPWAVASKHPEGLRSVGGADYVGLVLLEVLVFVALLGAGLAYVWRKGLFRWR
jgi:NADH-quinone oxidoreductase subunit A